MVQAVETTRIYLDHNRQGVITCIHCGVKRAINMSHYTDNYLGGKSLKAKCSACGRIFLVHFEFRRYHRINVNLPGRILQLSTRKKLDNVTVVSLSVNGIGFITDNNIMLNPEESYEIIFYLDDGNNSMICEEILIRRINGRFVGAEFHHNDKYNYELDFYIMSEL